MTYKELCLKWANTDSISEKEELAEQIEEIGRTFYNKKLDIYNKYKILVSSGEYCRDRGGIDVDNVSENSVGFEYHDSCMGCDYSDYISVLFSEISDENFLNSLESKMKKERKQNLLSDIKSHEYEIKRIEKELLKLQ